MNVPKKWWWLVGVAVPIVVAAIAILPDVIQKGDGGGGNTFTVIGTQFSDEVTFNNVSVIVEQARRTGGELPQSVVETLRQAIDLVQSRKFDEAIPLLHLAAEAAPVPALFNNLGAAYLATGNVQDAEEYLKRARSGGDEISTAFNLKQIKVAQDQATAKRTEKVAESQPARQALPGIGSISIPNLEVRRVEIYDQESPAKGTYSAGFVGEISPKEITLQVPAGTYKLKFAEHFLERINVERGKPTEILLGTIHIPNLSGRTVEVYSQDSNAKGTYSPGFAGQISPDATKLQVPSGIYKLKFAEHFLDSVVVQPGKEVVL